MLDWTTATHGNPVADVARTVLLFQGRSVPPGVGPVQRLVLQGARRLFCLLYLRAYRQQRPTPEHEIAAWTPIMAAARLSEGIEQEEDYLVAQVEHALRQS